MKYTDIRCEACGLPFREEDDVVVCPVCGAPQHRACWEKAERCVHEEAHGSGYVWISPESMKAKEAPAFEKKARAPRALDGETLENGEEIVVCPRCGARNFENDAFCLRCGQNLHPDNTKDGYSADEAHSQRPEFSEEVLKSLRLYGGLHPTSELDGIPVCEYADFVGGSSPGKIIRRVSLMERYGKKNSFFIPAFLFGHVWMLFRKMRKEGWVVGMVLILAYLCAGLLQINSAFVTYAKEVASLGTEITQIASSGGEMDQEEYDSFMERYNKIVDDYSNTKRTKSEMLREAAGETIHTFTWMGIPLYCGLRGLYHYRKKVKADIMHIRGECSDMQSYQKQLVHEGGVSAGGAVIGLLISLAAVVCYSYIPMLLAVLFF